MSNHIVQSVNYACATLNIRKLSARWYCI